MDYNFLNNIIIYNKDKSSWKFWGNGIIINNDFIVTASHIFENDKTYAISSIKNLRKKYIINNNDDFIYNNKIIGKHQTEIDLAIILNKWFIIKDEIEFEKQISIGEQIYIYGCNKEDNMPMEYLSLKTVTANKQLDNTWGCKLHEKMKPGISGSPVFNKNKKLLGIFITSFEKYSLGTFIKSEFIKSQLEVSKNS